MKKKMNKIYGLNIDALRLCYEVVDPYHIEQLKMIGMGERYYGFYEFYLERIEGKHFEYVYRIMYDEGTNTTIFAELRLGINKDDEGSNKHVSGLKKAWISIANKILYTNDIHYLGYITDNLGLAIHNITTLDVCIDMSKDIAMTLRKLIRNKNITTFLNRKQIKNRKEDRPEITFCMSGNMDRDKYLTTIIKQKKAIKDKSRGVTLTAYNKRAEITNSSQKDYIMDYYNSPTQLYRIEVHLNNQEIKDFVKQHIRDDNFHYYSLIFGEKILWKLMGYFLDSIIYFKNGKKLIDWGEILAGEITTTPLGEDSLQLNICNTGKKQ